MAPASQKGKKASSASKNARKEEPAPQQQLQEEEIVMKEAEEQKHEEQVGEEKEEEAVTAASAGVEDEDEEAAAAASAVVEDEDEEAAAAASAGGEDEDEDAAVEENGTVEEEEEEEEASVEEVAAEDIEEEEAEDIDEEGAEKAHEDRPGEEDMAMSNGHSASHGDGTKETVATAKDSSGDNVRPSGGKIFIGGLTRETTTEMLTGHFKKYGEITDSVIMKNRGHPRGFGFVTFADPSIVDRVLRDTHILDGRTVEAKRTVPREKMSAPIKGPKTKKIFVGGLTTSTTEEEFKNYFEKFGKITECQIMQDHRTGRSRGFGFVNFESEQVVEEILAQGKMHEIDGKQVEIKKAEPKRANEPPLGHDRGGHFGGRGGGGYNANTGFYGAFSGADAPYYGGAGGYYSRGAGRPGDYPYGGAYAYGGGFGGSNGYGYGDVDDGYGGMAYNYAGYGSGSGYGYNYGGGGYAVSSRGYGNGRYHPYNR